MVQRPSQDQRDPDAPLPSAPRLSGELERGTKAPGEAVVPPAIEALRRQATTLVDLLGDDSPTVHEAVRDELLRLGRPARAALRRALDSPHARRRGRSRAILLELDRRDSVRRLLRHAARPRIDLEQALFLLGGLETPGLDSRPYELALDAMADEVARRIAQESEPLARAMVLTHYLGGELGYLGSEVDYTHRDNIHLHRAIERKRGMPLTLCAIYLLVARRAGLRAGALPLPGHVLLRIRDEGRSLIVDPFHGGRIRTREDCLRYLADHSLAPRPEWFREASDRALFQRQALNLMNSEQMRGFSRRASDLHRIALVLGRPAERNAVGQSS